MAKLNQIISAILTEITKAQSISDTYSRNLKSSHREDPSLMMLSVPRTEIQDITIDLKFAISKDNFNTAILPLLGNYECHKYDSEGKNDWHYVTISKINDAVLKWSNRAGVSWKITLTEDRTKLDVGSDCPSLKYGHKQVTVVWENDQVLGLKGLFDEFYQKSNDIKVEEISTMSIEFMEIEVNSDYLEKLPETAISSISIKLGMTSV